MVAAIGSAALSSSSTIASPLAGLEAQIARYQKQLSDCVNCDSANTAQGKETIQQISNKISAARAKIEEINVTRAVNPVRQAEGSASTAAVQAGDGPDRVSRSGTATVGSIIDVVA